MTNREILTILDSLDKVIASGKFKATMQEKAFILSAGSICRTPQRLSDKQVKWLQSIYHMSKGGGFKA